ELAVVHRLPVRVRGDGGGRGRPNGDGPHPARGPWTGPGVRRRDRRGRGTVVSRLWLLAVVTAAAAGCDLPGRPDPAGRPVPADQVVDFATLFRQNCAGCHGADGQLGPAPPLNDPLFLALVPDAVLEQVVTEGRPGTPMPAFARSKGGSLTDAQVKAL